MIEINEVSFSYGKTEVLKKVTASIEKGKITTILGPNGCGKSTLMQLMVKGLRPKAGEISLASSNIREISLKAFAQQVAIVHQSNTAPPDIAVETLVSYGRTPYLVFGKPKGKEDREIVDWSMKVTDIYPYRNHPISALSGGQRQRIWIAMALAQKPQVLLLDEPTTYLDIHYQRQMLTLMRRLNEEYGMTIAMVLHDINQAIEFSHRIIGLRDGEVMIQGPTENLLHPDVLKRVFGVKLNVIRQGERAYVFC